VFFILSFDAENSESKLNAQDELMMMIVVNPHGFYTIATLEFFAKHYREYSAIFNDVFNVFEF
jgi:hypothetical protein